MITVAVSGGFDPLHIGHLEYFEQAKKLGDRLVVIVNNDAFLIRKRGRVFMPLADRVKIIKALKIVDEVVISIDKDDSVIETLRMVRPDIVGNGGDRTATEDELQLAKEIGFKMVWGLGGKIRSSSNIVNDYLKDTI